MEAVSLILLVTVVLYLVGGCIDGKDYRPADGEQEVEPVPAKVPALHADSCWGICNADLLRVCPQFVECRPQSQLNACTGVLAQGHSWPPPEALI